MKKTEIVNFSGQPLDPANLMAIASELIPSFRTCLAVEQKVQDNIMIRMTGGLGDNICAEPAIRYATETFKTANITVYGDTPEIYQHLPITQFRSTETAPDLSKYYVFDTFQQDGHLSNEFIGPPFTHCVDYATLNLWRCQIPRKDRWVKLVPSDIERAHADEMILQNDVVIHPGRTWPTRTMPKWWWDDVIRGLLRAGARPVLIGSEINHVTQTRGTVDVNAGECLDLRGVLSVMGSVAVTQAARVVLTNDSAPLHMAASGQAWIGFLSTVRHPEIITHYRSGGEFGWRMHDFARGGLYQSFNLHPGAKEQQTRFDAVRTSTMKSWLPDPAEVATWAVAKLALK